MRQSLSHDTVMYVIFQASLGEYCEPVDSRKTRRGISEENEDYNSDPDKRYSQPQGLFMFCCKTLSDTVSSLQLMHEIVEATLLK